MASQDENKNDQQSYLEVGVCVFDVDLQFRMRVSKLGFMSQVYAVCVSSSGCTLQHEKDMNAFVYWIAKRLKNNKTFVPK
jgi:hypothetical protein